MEPDLALTIGLLFAVLSLPLFLSGWVEQRVSRTGAILLVLGLGLAGYAYASTPGGYRFEDIPTIICAPQGSFSARPAGPRCPLAQPACPAYTGAF